MHNLTAGFISSALAGQAQAQAQAYEQARRDQSWQPTEAQRAVFERVCREPQQNCEMRDVTPKKLLIEVESK